MRNQDKLKGLAAELNKLEREREPKMRIDEYVDKITGKTRYVTISMPDFMISLFFAGIGVMSLITTFLYFMFK